MTLTTHSYATQTILSASLFSLKSNVASNSNEGIGELFIENAQDVKTLLTSLKATHTHLNIQILSQESRRKELDTLHNEVMKALNEELSILHQEINTLEEHQQGIVQETQKFQTLKAQEIEKDVYARRPPTEAEELQYSWYKNRMRAMEGQGQNFGR